MDETTSNSTVVSRRWLLGAAVVSTASTYIVMSPVALRYEVTAQGAGGTSVATSPVANVASTGSFVLKTLGPVGMNPDFIQTGYYGNGQPFLDRSKMSSGWTTTGTMTVNADGYPTSLSGGNAQLNHNVEFDHAPAGTENRFVLRCLYADWDIDAGGAAPISNHVDPNTGVRRIVFRYSRNRLVPQNGDSAYFGTCFVHSLVTPAVVGKPPISIVRLDQEVLLDAGEMFQPQFVDRSARTGGNRYMDWRHINEIENLAGDPALTAASWSKPTPIEVCIALSNKIGRPAWINIPLRSADADIVRCIGRARAVLGPTIPLYVELSNEVWNPGFAQFGQSEYLFQPPIPGGYSSYINYGYRAAQIMALILKATGYDPRIKPLLMGQAVASYVLQQATLGAETAIAEWSDPANTAGKQNAGNGTPNKGAVYDVDFAARFPNFGSLFSDIGSASYCDAGVGNPNASQADIATMQGWATGDQAAGLAQLKRQLYHGGLIDSGGLHLANWAALYAPEQALAVSKGVGRVSYESNASPIALHTPEIAALWSVFIHSADGRQFMEDMIAATLTAAGFRATMILADIAERNSTFGCLESPYDFTMPRFAAVVAAQAAALAGTLVAPTIA